MIYYPDDHDVSIIVLPLLRQFNDPPFETVGEAVDFFRQIFEVGCPSLFPLRCKSLITETQGLQFMHECRVAHRYEVHSALHYGT